MKMFCSDGLSQWSPTHVITCARKKWKEERGGSMCFYIYVCVPMSYICVCTCVHVCV